jgi:hypothetical protein
MEAQNENNHESGLKHGQFYVYHRNTDGKKIKQLVNPLSQEEIADGWYQVLPKPKKNSTTHHFSIYLSQLPPHLWNRIWLDEENPDTYEKIRDKIYTYSVKVSKHDNEIRKMYKLIRAQYPNLEEISQQFKLLQSARVKGWVMNRAHNLMHPKKDTN